MLGDRRAAARTPFRRAMSEVQPVVRVHLLQHPPDVLDVRVAEREVVVSPVHPLTETLRGARDLRCRRDDELAALARKRFEAVLLDLPLRVEPEAALDADLDPEPLAVEAVLVALVEAPERLIALEDVLQRPAPGVVDAERLVRRHGAVEEREARPAAVSLAQQPEGTLSLPPRENLLLEGGMVGHRRQRLKDWVGHREGKCREQRC